MQEPSQDVALDRHAALAHTQNLNGNEECCSIGVMGSEFLPNTPSITQSRDAAAG